MLPETLKSIDPARLSSVFEHSITWEDDVWKADPFDVDAVHLPARRRFRELLSAVTDTDRALPNRILLLHGQSGAGKTHLVRALRTYAHSHGKAYFGYAQMTPDVDSYAEYYLRRLIASLEKPYDPIIPGETGLARLANHLIENAVVLRPAEVTELREGALESGPLAKLVVRLADEIVTSPAFAGEDLDINIVRALLYMQRGDARIDQRVRQYLWGRSLNDLSHEAVAALDPNEGPDRAFEIIECLGRLMRIVDRAVLVFCIDQVEDLRFFPDAEERFKKAAADLIQIANRVPSSIMLITCLDDFYDQTREALPQSVIDRIEKAGPIRLAEIRSVAEARLIVGRRLEDAFVREGLAPGVDPSVVLGAGFMEELGGMSSRRLLEHTHKRWRELLGGGPVEDAAPVANGYGAVNGHGADAEAQTLVIKEQWDRFNNVFMAEIPSEESELMDLLIVALRLAGEERGREFGLDVSPVDWLKDVSAIDVAVRHPAGQSYTDRLFVCNRSIQGGGFKRQIERILSSTDGKSTVLVRATDFPPNPKSVAAQLVRRFTASGGRRLVIPIYELERMLTLQEFQSAHRQHGAFMPWLTTARPLSDLPSIRELLRLDMIERRPGIPAAVLQNGGRVGAGALALPIVAPGSWPRRPDVAEAIELGIPNDNVPGEAFEPPQLGNEDADEVVVSLGDPISIPQDSVRPVLPAGIVDAAPDEIPEDAALDPDRFTIGSAQDDGTGGIKLTRQILRRHVAVLGGSGSGKTTLALSVIEQLLLRGVPVVLIDRKGDLCSYANPDVWRQARSESPERRAHREELGSSIDVAVYTPGRTSGRPINITLLPGGIAELPSHEQQLLANVSAAAIGEMLHLKHSATHQRQSGILAVALKVLGSRSRSEVRLNDLIHLLEEDNEELIELTQRMDASGKARRDLMAQLDSLRHRNAALFDGLGEALRMESLLGLGPFARAGRTRLSIIYTGFLGDNENVLFWVSQFLSEALRFSQRNPSENLQAVIMFDEADLYIPASTKPATKEPLESLLKRARSAGIGIMLATQSPGDLDYRSRDQITSWFIGRVREDTALRKLRAAFASESGLDPARVLPNQTVGEFHLIQEGQVKAMRSKRSLISAEQVPFDRIEQLARETKRQEAQQLKLDFGA